MVGQLNLFAGKRQRGRKPRPAPEFALHCMIADDLKRFCHPAWRSTHIPLGEYRDTRTAVRLKRMGCVAGFPDFIFIGPNQSVFWLELKRRGGRTSNAQDDIFAHIRACGFELLVTNNYKEARDALIGHGILRGIRGGA